MPGQTQRARTAQGGRMTGIPSRRAPPTADAEPSWTRDSTPPDRNCPLCPVSTPSKSTKGDI